LHRNKRIAVPSSPSEKYAAPPRGRGTDAGFSLLEISVVLGIISLITGGLLSFSSLQTERNNRNETLNKLQAIELALQRHAYVTESLPCPASRLSMPNDANYGVEQVGCTTGTPAGTATAGAGINAISIGVVPTRTLNLPDNYMLDAWGNRITYAVIKGLTDQKGIRFYTSTATNNVINIVDRNNNQLNDANPLSIVAYVALSHGKNGRGAYTKSAMPRICTAGFNDSQNCNDDIVFMDARIVASETSSSFDDLVRWKTLSFLKPMPSTSLNRQGKILKTDTEENFITGNAFASLAIDSRRQLYSWGQNDDAALGNSTNVATTHNAPTLLTPDIDDWTYIDADWGVQAALRANGKAYLWGQNDAGQMGNGTLGGMYFFPQSVAGGFSWRQIKPSRYFVCGRTMENAIYCWGSGSNGQNGVSPVNSSVFSPQRVGSASDWSDIETGQLFSCGIRSGGRVFCWGSNAEGAFGNTVTSGNTATPQPGGFIGGVQGTDWVDISTTSQHVCGRRTNGTLYCWGKGSNGAIGNGMFGGDYPTPFQVAFADWEFVHAATWHSCGIRNNGVAYCWGDNSAGQLGIGFAAGVHQGTPTALDTPYTDWVSLSGDSSHTCGYRRNRTFWCWGSNAYRKLGNGTLDTIAPVQVLNGGGTAFQ
jgi:prepilin-type N-terminal cleavage/methylation domain-containing protein